MAANGEALTSGGYIKHHLTNLTYGQNPDGSWGLAHSAQEAADMGFMAFHLDSMVWSIGLAIILFTIFYKVAKGFSVESLLWRWYQRIRTMFQRIVEF